MLANEEVYDLLMVLGYGKAPNTTNAAHLTPHYFCVASKQPAEQFHTLCVAAAWLLNSLGQRFDPPERFDDPNAALSQLVSALKQVRFLNNIQR